MLLHKYADELLQSGLHRLIVAVDGASKKSHESYRIGSDFDLVINNIKRFCKEKKKIGIHDLDVRLQFIVMAENENEIADIIKLGKKIGVDSVHLKTVSLGSFRDIQEKIKIKDKYLPRDSRYSRYSEKDLKIKSSYCYWIWSTVILWNGDVTTCCYDFNGDHVFSNILAVGGFSNLWRSQNYGRVRKNMLNMKFKLCPTCSLSDSYYTESVSFK
jgi:MoaA/NifB/PqqE/SkfB family radical SAM enzyme